MKLEYQPQRDAEFFEAIKKAVNKAEGRITLKQAIESAIMTPTSSFFLTDRRIAEIIRNFGSDPPPVSDAKRKQHIELWTRYLVLQNIHRNLTAEEIAKTYIAHQPASRFFISPARAVNIYCNELRRRQKARRK